MATEQLDVNDPRFHDDQNLARSLIVRSKQNTTAQTPTFGYSLMLHYGQSKCVGEQGFPAVTTTPAYPEEVFMLGASPRPVGLSIKAKSIETYDTWVDNNFHPLVCTNQDGLSTTIPLFSAGALTANNVSVEVVGSGESTVGTFSWAGSPAATATFIAGDSFQCDGFTSATGNNAIGTSGRGNVFLITSVSSGAGISRIVANGVASAQNTTSPESGIVFAPIPTTLYFGEEAGVTQLNELRALQLDNYGLTQDTSHKWVMANGGVSGQTIAQLSKIPPMGDDDLYIRVTEAATIFAATAGGLGESYGMPAVLFNQGGSDETANTPSADYKTSYEALVDDVTADIAVAIFSQSAPPFWFGVVVDGGAINTGIIAQAQMELFGCSPATGFDTPYTPNMYMIGGSYQMPDHSNHLSQNGYRWLGAMSAKVMNQVMFLGEGWKPLHVIAITYTPGQVVLDFHVPVPPLQTKCVFVIQELTMLNNYGFSLYQCETEVAIGTVTIGETTITITFDDPVSVPPTVSYADMNNTGSGNICDSDATVALDNWLFTAGSGQYLTENFPTPGAQIVSNGQPYPLWNFLCPFTKIQAVSA